tara:strand:+ start:13381 stop:14229 length:849 start_codon:yes stop_codon:yes gene_type:complete
MAFNVGDFKSQITKTGLARTNKFYFTAGWPSSINKVISSSYNEPKSVQSHLNASSDIATGPASMVSWLCDTATFPGKNIETFDYRPQAFGKLSKVPTGVAFDPLQTTVMMDSKQEVRKYLELWQNTIINTSSDKKGELTTFQGKTPYEIGYKKDFSVQAEISWFSDDIGDVNSSNQGTRRALRMVFKDVFPMQIGSITLGWEQNDQIARLPVEWAYSSYYLEEVEIPIEVANSRGTSIFQEISRLGSIAGTLNSLDKPRSIQDAINTVTRIDNIFRNLDSIF